MRRRKQIDPVKVSDLWEHFFKYVTENHPDWHSNCDMEELRKCFKEEYAPSLILQQGVPSKPVCGFGTMMYRLRRQKKLKCSKGKVSFYEKTGYATVDQHRRPVKREGSEGVVQQNREYPALCEECGVILNSASQQQDHIKGARHRLNLTKQYLKKNRDMLIEDKHGVSIVSKEGLDVEDGKITINVTEGEISVTELLIRCSDVPVTLLLVTPLVVDSRVNVSDAKGVSEGKVSLLFQKGDEYKIKVRCEARNYGEIRTPIAFAFKLSSSETFHIARNVVFSVSGENQEDLQQTAPYSRLSKIRLDPFSKDVLHGIQFAFSDGGKLTQKVSLEHYNIPSQVNRLLNSNKPEEVDELSSPLTVNNYSQKFRSLLYSEEHQMKVDITRYDMKGVTMTKSRQHRGLLNLEVPGLAENRPSVLRGDHLSAAKSEGSRDKTYRGYVHHVEQEVVSLSFHESLVSNFIENMTFDIQFTFSRYPLRLQHYAVDPANLMMDEMRSVLFPENQGFQPTDPEKIKSKNKLFDNKLSSNFEQVQAIYHIVEGSSKPAPYLVFGPPGTGKTVTIVEAMKQVYQSKTNFILACAPSNSAADLIAKRILENGPVAKSSLLRMSASSRSWDAVDPELKEKFRECLNYDLNHSIYFPSADDIKEKRIVVTTMVTAGRLVLTDCFKDHFTHIFLDEAGHAVEPEALIPISGLLPRNGQLVMAGDPKQLGPVLRSPVSKSNGLELSLLERLMTTEEAYKRQPNGKYNDHLLTKLLRNYRSHPAILEKPNEMFYDSELLVCADEIMRNSLQTFDQLPSKGFPIIFHGIEGKDEREENSPSFFNVAEAQQVMKYTNDLLEMRGGKAIRKTDIGIISPYRKQVQKIQKLLRKKNWTDIKVGSVEEFQGQERLIIIISTVRSTREEFLQLDRDYKLGFLKNPKRFNVAITRAKALLICIGNPHMLSKDENWNGFLRYCLENNAYTGCPYTPDTEESEMITLTEKMARLNIPKLTFTEEEAAAVNDPEWRGDR